MECSSVNIFHYCEVFLKSNSLILTFQIIFIFFELTKNNTVLIDYINNSARIRILEAFNPYSSDDSYNTLTIQSMLMPNI